MSTVDKKLEVVVIPVSDAERAKDFYGRFGWRLDADVARRYMVAEQAGTELPT
jgi:catechol 2,3-dioxygenase-like lactoylglutathione lyase family enzyme